MLTRTLFIISVALCIGGCKNNQDRFPPVKIDPQKLLKDANIKTTPASCPPAPEFRFKNNSWDFTQGSKYLKANWSIDDSSIQSVSGFNQFSSASFNGTAVNGVITCFYVDTNSTRIAVLFTPSVVIPLGKNWSGKNSNLPMCWGPITTNCMFGKIDEKSNIIKKLPGPNR
jgi:hypothetical protein